MTQSVCTVEVENLIHAFLVCKNVTNVWRSIELWSRGSLKQHVKLLEIDKIFGIHNGDIPVNTFILAAKEVKTGGPKNLLQVKKRLLSQM